MTGILSRYRFANGTGRYVMTIYRLALLLLTVLQNQNLPLDLQCTFDIDNLPVRFGSLSDDGTVDRARMNNASVLSSITRTGVYCLYCTVYAVRIR
jgi:hypothetical protein